MTTNLYLIEWDDEHQNASIRMNPTADAIAAHIRNAAADVASMFNAAAWRADRLAYQRQLQRDIDAVLYPPIRWQARGRVRYDRSIHAQDARFTELRNSRNEWLWR